MKRYHHVNGGHLRLNQEGTLVTYADAIAFARRVAQLAYEEGRKDGVIGRDSRITDDCDYVVEQAERDG